MLNYITLKLGELQTNCYLVWDSQTKETVVIDPADDGVGIAMEINRLNLIPKGVLITHGHFDHVLGALDLKLIYQIPFYGSQADQFLLNRQKETAKFFLKREIEVPNFLKIDIDLDQITEIHIGSFRMEIIKTPGHTPGSVCFYQKEMGWLFSGDTIFSQGVGRTDYSYGRKANLEESLIKLKSLPADTLVLPGHGESGQLGRCFKGGDGFVEIG